MEILLLNLNFLLFCFADPDLDAIQKYDVWQGKVIRKNIYGCGSFYLYH